MDCSGKGARIIFSLSSLMENMKVDLHEATQLLNIPEDEYAHYAKMMK